MYSISIDYIFNRVYDVLLWIKYVWLFSILRTNPDTYLESHKTWEWDGLRDRGWFDEYLASKDAVVPVAETQLSVWQRLLEKLGITLSDSDGDGIADISDTSPFDASNATQSQLKERYEADYSFMDKVRDFFGFGPKDTDNDTVPDSYEAKHGLDSNSVDTDRDGVLDGQELLQGTDPKNNDTDGDLVIDGRDEAPLDPTISSKGVDTDGDGVSDAVETIIGIDLTKKDTDSDGIPDGIDTYPLDPNNIGQIPTLDFTNGTEPLHFSIQNPVLSLFSQLLSVAAIVLLMGLVYIFCRWFIAFLESLNHYEHHFEHGSHGHDSLHVIGHNTPQHIDEEMPAGIHNLPIHENAPSIPPTAADFEDHPRFAIIQGYLSSESEALWRIGIMEADTMLEEVLREKGYMGQTVADMLKEASFKTVSMAWDAHKVRNRIAHDGSAFELTEREAKRAFMLYESVFRELKAIH